MPTYDYTCKSCGFALETMQKITEAPLTTCPQCKKEDLIRGVGGGALFCFKGSGFYLTDYKKSEMSSSIKKPSCGCKSTHSCD